MRKFIPPTVVFWFLPVILLLSACNMPLQSQESTPDKTRVFQTQEAAVTRIGLLAASATVTQTPENGTNEQTTFEPTLTDTPAGPCDSAAAGFPQMDITIPDGMVVEPGQLFIKTWRIYNSGTCIWTPDYQLVFFSGDQLANTKSIQLDEPVEPSDEVDLSIEMTAPQKPGTYQSNWKLQNEDGDYFGIGPNGASPFWARIEVVDNNTPTATFVPTVTSSPTPSTVVSGDVLLQANKLLDLDTLQIQEAGADLKIEPSGESNQAAHQLQTRNGAQFSLFGSARPTLEECKNAPLGTESVSLPDMALGVYYCYRTDTGLPGWFYPDSLDLEAPSLYLVINTWLQP